MNQNNSIFQNTYNPDVLVCMANLSNDEVFTPPAVANKMLDLLPSSIFSDPNSKFLDPACKTGVFLREIVKRLDKGLKNTIKDRNQRINHILKNQVFGIAITEMTSLMSRRSLYCSKYPNSRYSVTMFDRPEGNIKFTNLSHKWVNKKCSFCGASEEGYNRGDNKESHAYEFIHTLNPEEVFNMKFDVIISNPPYQLSTQKTSRQAIPIYHKFIDQAKKLNPKFITMIIPSRWFSGGMGLDKFRNTMLNDEQIRNLVDYPNSHDVFNGVDIPGGVCYFLWENGSSGKCKVSNFIDGNVESSYRYLNEFNTFVRFEKAVPIIRKIFNIEKPKITMDKIVSSAKPFGLSTNYKPKESGVPCWFIQRIGRKYADKKDIDDTNNYLNKWKLLVPRSPIAGQTDFTKPVGFYYDGNTIISKPGECCTESFLVAASFDSEKEVKSFKSYLFTKTVRFLLLQNVISQDVLRNKYTFVPYLDKYDHVFSDDELRERWNISNEEWAYIDSRIHNYDKD